MAPTRRNNYHNREPKQKFYAVRNGRRPGIYYSWPQCKAQIHGYSKAEHKGFKTLEEARSYLHEKNYETAPSSSWLINHDEHGSKKNKFYAVRVGRKPGVYHSWVECQKQTKGFSCAKFKSFRTRKEANSYMRERDSTLQIKKEEVENP